MDSQLMERAEAAEVELLKSILHSLPPIRCAVIGVRVTGRPNPPLPYTHHLPTHPFLRWRMGGAETVLRFPGENIYSWGLVLEEESPYLPTARFSVGAAGGYRGDPSTATRSRWLGRHCHLLPKKTCTCHTRVGVLPRL